MSRLEDLVGQRLMIGVRGARCTREMIAQFRRTRAGGVIFFRPNFKSAAAFRKLITDLQDALERKLLTAVDHEGGRVIHLAEGVTVFPDNLCVGNTGNPAYAARQGKIEACELTALGISLNLAPTVDVLTARFSPNIGTRSYGSNPKLVSQFAAARIRAMQAGGVAACAKHFPGQGQSPLDAHLVLPVLASPRKEIDRIHLAPFRAAIQAGVRAIMSSHPVYPKLDPEKIPATFSRKIVHCLLRRELGFRGIILSDDLEMGALKKFGSSGEIAIRSVRAGHDIILFCRDAHAQAAAHAALCRAYRNRELDWRELEESVERIRGLKGKNYLPSSSPRVFRRGSNDFDSRLKARGNDETYETDSLPLEIARRGIRCATLPPAGRSVLVIFPGLSALASKIYIEKEMLNGKKFLNRLLRGLNKRGHSTAPTVIEESKVVHEKSGLPQLPISNAMRAGAVSPFIVGLDPSQREIQKAIRASKAASLTIFFCYDAHLLKGCRKLLRELQQEAPNLVTVLLRDPYDVELIQKGGARRASPSSFVQAYGFRACQIQAVLERIFKTGR